MTQEVYLVQYVQRLKNMTYWFEKCLYIIVQGILDHSSRAKWRRSPTASFPIKLLGGVYGIGQSPLGVYLAAEAESRWRVNGLESVHTTELWVNWMCDVRDSESLVLRRSLLGQISLFLSNNNHPPQQRQLLRDSPQTKKGRKNLSWMPHLFWATFPPKHSLKTFSDDWYHVLATNTYIYLSLI